jgi:hypothetical protein
MILAPLRAFKTMRFLALSIPWIVVLHTQIFCSCYDCNEGCDLDPAVNGNVVCGVDRIVYPNECFAVCQVKFLS